MATKDGREHQRRNQARIARLEIVSQMYLRGNSVRKIRAEVMRRLDLAAYSTQTVHSDIHFLLKEWHESRLTNVNDALQVELTRIDETICELWEQWEKSKQDYTKTSSKRKGAPVRAENNGNGQQGAQGGGGERLRTVYREEQETQVQGLGNPAYIAEIRQQLAERRKLLGLYSAEKREIKTIAEEINREELEAELRRLRLITDSPADTDSTQA